MAEALAILGLVANIQQFVSLAVRVVQRLHDFSSRVKKIPDALLHAQILLPSLTNSLTLTSLRYQEPLTLEDKQSIESSIGPVVQECTTQIRNIEDILNRILPSDNTPNWSRALMAYKSLAYDKRIRDINSNIDRYIRSLTYHHISNMDHMFHRALLQSVESTSAYGHIRVACSTVGYDPDPDFVGRKDILKDIETRFEENQERVAIYGMGGTG